MVVEDRAVAWAYGQRRVYVSPSSIWTRRFSATGLTSPHDGTAWGPWSRLSVLTFALKRKRRYLCKFRKTCGVKAAVSRVILLAVCFASSARDCRGLGRGSKSDSKSLDQAINLRPTSAREDAGPNIAAGGLTYPDASAKSS